MGETVEIRAGDGSTARIALRGAEPVSWQVEGREYLWNGNPEHWNRSAPWLFPVVGASAGGEVQVEGRRYPMAQHGFARDLPFAVVGWSDDAVSLSLSDDEATRAHYPFPFRLTIEARIAPRALDFKISVENPGETSLPYALGFHPAFPWPFADGERRAGGGYTVLFEEAERPFVPEVGAGGLLVRSERALPLDGARLDLDPELFTEALAFLNARSRSMRFEAPNGRAIAMRMDDFPHLAVWTKPTAPFLSLEAWTGHADWADFDGALAERDSQRLLAPGATARHGIALAIEG
ncbi:MAG TPA: aldose 1-epimerase family protein [Methylobacterium sp.]|jgi:galactose mutarotase-like enzyme|uniref:aldose 1-epimerase family protein n=1 Tax=Methylorubrum sp. B1-46 TaxID=2897334 RepID=UPI001E4AB791|nr:aldose 1-epimerase family protein [Methylorubrum sp. B1-46]UGB23921.1 aldose 1-epimerase family protein [Methylorubrum sp. B1-46]HEV2542545.1 aldose 1-epimerase family protein [Methylobacterium sp.]